MCDSLAKLHDLLYISRIGITPSIGVTTTTDTTDSVRTSFGRPQKLYGMSVQVLAKKNVYLKKKVLKTVNHLTNLAIIL